MRYQVEKWNDEWVDLSVVIESLSAHPHQTHHTYAQLRLLHLLTLCFFQALNLRFSRDEIPSPCISLFMLKLQ